MVQNIFFQLAFFFFFFSFFFFLFFFSFFADANIAVDPATTPFALFVVTTGVVEADNLDVLSSCCFNALSVVLLKEQLPFIFFLMTMCVFDFWVVKYSDAGVEIR